MSSILIDERQDQSIRLPAPPLLPRLGGRPVRVMARVGIFLLAIGLLGTFAQNGGVDGIFWAVVGTIMTVPFVRETSAVRRGRRQDLRDATTLAAALRAGRLPDAVEPTRLHAEGQRLEMDEVCFVDGVEVEVFQFYGEPVVRRQGFILVWGSLGAWIFTAIANYLWRSHNRAHDRKAAPRWRDAERGRLWVTDRRYIIRSLVGRQDWVQLPWNLMSGVSLLDDGIALVLAEMGDRPCKLKMANPAWQYTLLRRLTHGVIDYGQLSGVA